MPTYEAKFQLKSNFGASMSIAIHDERTTIGRGSQASIVIDEPNMPPLLGAIIQSMDEYYLIADQENIPFMLNGSPTLRKILKDGDSIHFDQCQLIFSFAPKREMSSITPSQTIGHDLITVDETTPSITFLRNSESSEPSAAIEAKPQSKTIEPNYANHVKNPRPTSDWPHGAWAALIPCHDRTMAPLFLFKPITVVEFTRPRPSSACEIIRFMFH